MYEQYDKDEDEFYKRFLCASLKNEATLPYILECIDEATFKSDPIYYLTFKECAKNINDINLVKRMCCKFNLGHEIIDKILLDRL
jgi:hypothetical protein